MEYNKNKEIVTKMIKYCENILTIVKEEELDKEKYLNKKTPQLAIDMCIFQLSELSIHLDDDFKKNHNDIPWTEIRGMRNIHAHEYDKVDRNIIWNTIEKDIPSLTNKLKIIEF